MHLNLGGLESYPSSSFVWAIHSRPEVANRTINQPRPKGLLLVQNGGRRNPWPRLPKWYRKFVGISLPKHDEMSSFCLNNGFWLQKTNTDARHWKQPPKKPLHCVMWQNTPRFVEYLSSPGQRFLRPPFWTRRRPWGRGWRSINQSIGPEHRHQFAL